jgi:glutamate/tyrosine decarboxylase-like PLP-dependent enzyme
MRTKKKLKKRKAQPSVPQSKAKRGRKQPLLERNSVETLKRLLNTLEKGFGTLPPFDGASADSSALETVLAETAERLQDNFPYFHPLYAGQMLKPPHPVARLAYALAMWINPNNHALDGGRASSAMEKEAVAHIAAMVGWKTHLGHLTGGGTMANLEALWIGGRINPGKAVLASEQAHYTHHRISGVLGLPFEPLSSDRRGRLDVQALEKRLKQGGVGTVVATIGTTATGAVDPLPEILTLRERYGFRVHADAAYGGYFRLAGNLAPDTAKSFDCLGEADSIVIDPHKHGLQPYGCGCVMFRDPAVGQFYKHDSPYTYFSSKDLHLGEISLECSRPGASAVALWATHKLLPLTRRGSFAKMLERSRAAAVSLQNRIQSDKRFVASSPPELDILVWIPVAPTVSRVSLLSRSVFHEAARNNLHLALAELPTWFFDLDSAGIKSDRNSVTCLRSVLMKPEHLEWVDQIWAILDRSI